MPYNNRDIASWLGAVGLGAHLRSSVGANDPKNAYVTCPSLDAGDRGDRGRLGRERLELLHEAVERTPLGEDPMSAEAIASRLLADEERGRLARAELHGQAREAVEVDNGRLGHAGELSRGRDRSSSDDVEAMPAEQERRHACEAWISRNEEHPHGPKPLNIPHRRLRVEVRAPGGEHTAARIAIRYVEGRALPVLSVRTSR